VQNGFLTVKHNTDSKAIFSVLLAHFEADGETLSWIVTADETLVHYFEPETKSQPVEWHRPQSSWKKKFKKSLSAGMAMS